MKCNKCHREADFYIPYAGLHLCKEHFTEFIDMKVKHEIREQIKFRSDDRVLIAVSGGKDSMLLMYQMHKIFGRWRNFEMLSVTVDEGLGDFRQKCAKLAREYASSLDIEHRTITFKKYLDITTDDVAIADKKLKPCTYCGVFRRKILNIYAKEVSAKYILLGLNLDDFAQSVVMNVTRGDVARLARLAPHRRIVEGFVPRLAPLRRVLEEEIKNYNKVVGIPYYNKRCPYAHLAIRDRYRAFLNELEKSDPAVKFSILNFLDKLKLYIEDKEKVKMNRCKLCGEPTIGDICKACELKLRYKKIVSQQ